ncbi:hypothetical protein UJ101_02384 [Flavobacteriaceae bacterium UJ101]|nr:hypothetical protein UJ101_02384 [Flavobacteriaceae bacterium UJ101]
MLRIIKNTTTQQLLINDYSLLLISDWNDTIIHHVVNHDALLITTQHKDSFHTIVSNIRSHNDPELFLKPLFYKYDISSNYTIHTDGKLNELTFTNIIDGINQKFSEIQTTIPNKSFKESITNRFLQYIYSRNGKIDAHKDRNSKLGYLFPFISLFYDKESFSIFNLLDSIEKRNLITSTIKDQIQLCNPCHDSYLIYKETCPKCGSIHITPQDIIHHFVCAHVAPEQDFKKESTDEMECPKCNKHLRHIGIDYDKPSAVYHCNNCLHDFQNAKVVAECHTCDHQNHLEELIQVAIKEYSLTLEGIHHVQNGSRMHSANDPSVSDSLFYQLVKRESKRENPVHPSCFVGIISMNTILLERLNDHYKNKLKQEIKTIINQYIEDSNYQTADKENHYILLLDQSESEAQKILEKLENNLIKLLSDNLHITLKINSKLQSIHKFKSSSA